MDSTGPRGSFLASFLVLVLFRDLTEACSCLPTDLQKACCYSPLVMRAKFMSVSRDTDSPSYVPRNIYEIKPTKVIKGPKEIIDARFLYTSSLDIYCGYEHQGPLNGEEYIFSDDSLSTAMTRGLSELPRHSFSQFSNMDIDNGIGSFSDNRLRISLCSFAKPWDQLTPAEKKILNKNGAETCSCPVP